MFCGYLKVIRSKQLNGNIEYNAKEYESFNSIVVELKRQLKIKFENSGRVQGVTVIFCRTITMAKRLVSIINEYESEIYHGEMTDDEKRRVEDKVITGGLKLVFATLAFGLGIDLPDIDLIFMVGMFDSIFDVVQMSGRGGRTGGTMKCRTFNFFTEEMIKDSNLTQNQFDSNEKFAVSKKQDRQMLEDWLKNQTVCRITGISSFLHNKYNDCSINSNPPCDNCKLEIDDNNEDLSNEFDLIPDDFFFESTEPMITSTVSDVQVARIQGNSSPANNNPLLRTPVKEINTVLRSPSMNERLLRTPSAINQKLESPLRFFGTSQSDYQNLTTPSVSSQILTSPSIKNRAIEAEKGIIEEQILIDKLKEFCQVFDSTCIYCAFNGSTKNHKLAQCPYMRNKCLKCFESGHGSMNCLFKTLPIGLCFVCGMKGEINGVSIHNNNKFGKSCDSLAKDKVLPILAMIFQKDEKGELKSKMNFGTWRNDQLGPSMKFLSTINNWFESYRGKRFSESPNPFMSIKRPTGVLSEKRDSIACMWKRTQEYESPSKK